MIVVGAIFGAGAELLLSRSGVEREREERERDVSATLTHLVMAPNGRTTIPVTSVPDGLMRIPFPNIRFDPAPSPKETRLR
jgi:hypothetical protein